ncbi:MAG TPA: hypothetical protein PLO24_07530 [Bacteroidales bacterium]|jgi:hypothetical protein|nr:hypothetical protein [Bacteroidales bacterium]HOS71918.1 hypothetical protein [Bacteroidales bacterium]HQH24599.1 hypothetical protein [Bacteroidales bacterium]HQJ82527.1 hypothetical protein [Bacteroidales bacterium]
MLCKLLLLAVFGLAMAHFEGVVVFYLRKVLGLNDTVSNRESVREFPKRYLYIEMTREAATIIMLVAIAILAGSTWIERGILFLWTFAFWDLFYYLSLYILTGWPENLKATDVLFLIPVPWIAPVWLPVGISSATIIVIALLFLFNII